MDNLSLEAYSTCPIGVGIVGLAMLWLRSSGAELKASHPPILQSSFQEERTNSLLAQGLSGTVLQHWL